MRFRRTLLPLLSFLLVLSAHASAYQMRTFTPEIALDVRNVRIAAVTDDGRRVAATVQTRRDRTDVDHQRYGDPTYLSPVSTRLMVIDTRTGEQTWVHDEPAQLRGFTWSPDGDRLGYFMAHDGRYELHLFDATTGEWTMPELETDKEISSSSTLVWSPDGTTILIALRPEGWATAAREAFLALTDAPVIVQDSRNDFLAWDRVRNIADREITALVTIADGSVREILAETPPRGVDFSEDGTYLTYTTATPTKTSYTRRDGTDYALSVLDLANGEPETLMGPREERINVSWTDARDAFAYSDEGSVFVRRIGEEEAVDVTEAHRTAKADEEEPGAPVTGDRPDTGGGRGTAGAGDDVDRGELTPRFSVERWSPDGDRLLLTTDEGWHLLDLQSNELRDLLLLEEDEDERPRRSVQAWGEDGYLYFSYSERDRWWRGLKRLAVASGDVETLMLDDNLYGSWNVSEDGGTIVYTMSDGNRPSEIWVAGRDHAAPTPLTSSNPQLDDVALTHTELVEYLDVDGNTLYGILYYPIGYREGQTYPLVAEIYEDFFDNGFNENMNLITAQGWFGFRPSVQFEEGYPGEAWLKAVPTAINKLIERGLVDKDKVGVYGQSYGGYAVNLLITQTDRFAAAANVSGKVNIISFLGDSPKITTRNYAAAEVGQDRIGATLWEQPHKYIQTSAVMFADRIDTPLLMLSGEGDWNVPATNQREMYYALRRLGKEVVWVHYTAGGHGAGRASSAADFVDHWQRMFDWFAEHFTDEDDGEGAPDGGGR
jgi:dipeptidyl aminopeptidase/acylaminoacyl peptidase